ncbi:MAG: trimethylamine methyltransferase family protein [Deltaproteobacteria bacterium]|nr:trimethylamine methyltransferase family protein [Deltaproteobacteria bacterium]
MKANQVIFSSPQFQILSDKQIQALCDAGLEILERTGVHIHHPEAVDILQGAGARVLESEPTKFNVKIPSYLVEKAIRTVPKRFTVYNRRGERTLLVEGQNVYFGTNASAINYSDPITGEARLFGPEDSANAARVADYLDHIDFVMFGGQLGDCISSKISDRISFKQVVCNTTRPIMFCCYSSQAAQDILDMAELVVGGHERYRNRPFLMHYSEPISPLVHGFEGVDKLLFCADHSIPLIYIPMPLGGATAPATLAGILAVNIAEVMSGLVIHQLRKEGAPFVFGGIPSVMDARTMAYPYGAPESALLIACLTEISHYFSLPMFGTAGFTDSKLLDVQCGVDVAFSVLMAALSGAHLVHDVGLLSTAPSLSFELMVLGNEIIRWIEHVMQGISITPETLCLDLIHKVGPGGNFLQEDHTFEHYREWYFSRFFDHNPHEKWAEEGRRIMLDHLHEKVQSILQAHRPEPLPQDVVRMLDEMEKKWISTVMSTKGAA